jgi:septum formation protein
MHLVLGSTSKARSYLLQELGVSFTVRSPSFDERLVPLNSDPVAYCQELALKKNISLASLNLQEVIITCDTIVYCGGKILNKPLDYKEAFKMLQFLSGKKHQVLSALCVGIGDDRKVNHEITEVEFNHLTDLQIEKFLLDPHYIHRSGSYTLSGKGSLLVKKIHGSYENVIGLPFNLLEKMLNHWGLSLWD